MTVSCDEGYHFTKWTKNNSESEINPFTEQTGVKGGETINFWAWFAVDEVKVPEKPVSAELPYVTVICTNTNASHSVLERNYYILDEEIAEFCLVDLQFSHRLIIASRIDLPGHDKICEKSCHIVKYKACTK